MRSTTSTAHMRALKSLLLALLAWTFESPARAQLIPGIEEWAEASVAAATSRWVGQRVAFPTPSERPQTTLHVRSALSPLSLHATERVSLARAERLLRALEVAHMQLSALGLASRFGDGGEGGTGDHDVYVIDGIDAGAEARLDASEPLSALDSASAFGLLDARLPSELFETCATQALAEIFLFELDPAEAPSVRKASAAYFAELATGRLGCDDAAERANTSLHASPFPLEPSTRGAAFLSALGARADGGSGVFLSQMWHFARQATWEGEGLRGSPDLVEAIEKALELRYQKLEDVAAELAVEALMSLSTRPLGAPDDPRRAMLAGEARFDGLPKHFAPADPPIEPFGAAYALVHTQGAKRGDRLRIWSRGESGVRWALTAARYDQTGRMLSRVRAPARKNPHSYLIVELDERTTHVLIAVANVADGTPDADAEHPEEVRSVLLIVDR